MIFANVSGGKFLRFSVSITGRAVKTKERYRACR